MLKELLTELVDRPIVVDENPLIYQRKLMQRWQNKKAQERGMASRAREMAGEELSDEEFTASLEEELAIMDVLHS